MEIYRADGWLGAIAAAEPGSIVDLAKHRLTENTAYDAECAYSPDGKWIVFTSDRTGDSDIYVMRADGSNQTPIVVAKGYDGGPFFSPDGKRIVFRSDRKGNDNLQIFVADLVFDASGNITGTRNEKQLTDDANVNWGPYWHPDGKHIIYSTSAQGHTNYEIYLMTDEGKRRTRITFSPGADVLPVISPNGKYLMWSSKRSADKTTQVFIARFNLPRGS
jgi:Tol biopolymer transport system component